ncbi:ankyrin repeat domain-containing protein [Paenibacillus cisolokensis]|uniref:ankyrin repeat domain-containing protein n=1 Tax=Paenibacillus cisolokensis TaxID=1658519 RepID=UPI003D2A62E7
MKKKWTTVPSFVLGAVVGTALTAGTAVGAAYYLKAVPSEIAVVVDNEEVKLSAPPVVIDNKLYVPVREYSNALGYRVSSVQSDQIGIVKEEGPESSVSAPASDFPPPSSSSSYSPSAPSSLFERQIVSDLGDRLKVNGEIIIEKIFLMVAAGEITLVSKDEATGNGLLHYIIMSENESLYEPVVNLDGQAGNLDYNLRNLEGQTPLHMAVIHQSDFYLDKLLNVHQVDATIKDAHGKTPLDYADKGSAIYEKLEKYLTSR